MISVHQMVAVNLPWANADLLLAVVFHMNQISEHSGWWLFDWRAEPNADDQSSQIQALALPMGSWN